MVSKGLSQILDRPTGFQPAGSFGIGRNYASLLWGLLGGLLVWLAFPPVEFSWLAYFAPLPWLWLISNKPDSESPLGEESRLASAPSYSQLYLAGFLLWMLWIQWIRLPHWMTYFGWIVLSAYLGIYLPLFVGLTRELVHRWKCPLVVSAPCVWTGLEFVRGYLFTGFSMVLLGHTQVKLLPLIQLADVAGAYVVSYLVMCVASGVATAIFHQTPRKYVSLGASLLLAVVAWAYGEARLTHIRAQIDASAKPAVRVGLIQGSVDTRFDDPQDPELTFARYIELTREFLRSHGQVDLIVWPESMCTRPWIETEAGFAIPEDAKEGESPEHFRERMEELRESCRKGLGLLARDFQSAVLLGCSTYVFQQSELQRFNSVIAANASGEFLARYDKMHPVMFGEYIPLGGWFPWLYKLSPMGEGLTPGAGPQAIQVSGLSLCPCICFENTIPHLIRGQVRSLTKAGKMPDVLVTATNDGWFWGSSLLDVHLACGVFRAVEMRLPMLIAANTGFSAWIDATGEVRAQGPRRAEGQLLAEVTHSCPIRRPYLDYGDLFAWGCLFVTVAGMGSGVRFRNRWSPRSQTQSK